MVERALVPYARLAWAWCRALAQYPVSLVLLTLAQLGATGVELLALLFVFGHVDALAGFTLHEALLVYGLTGTAFWLADLLMGSVERLGEHIRTGSFDTMLVRPVSPLVQLATDEFSPRRLGKNVPSAVALATALGALDIDWTPGRAAMLVVLVVSGTAICCALWVLGACVQFFVTEARELANALTYGGSALSEYPLAIYGHGVARAATFLVPLAFISYQPALYLLDRPDPLGMWPHLRYASPVVAVLLCALAAAAWRTGLRHYRSTGS
ncbi:ABC transporter permease [Actinorugispora endophytica]|uniref:ABC-2 type transport system permease protein n=1 Tax=Actinorugispora endophytica TaxID=1605990 RepID=A0A4V3D8V7_9ACTN|nr:ABC-2 family transporter protein [Actinorugispora endophytica]TDQ53359.1 ABC-2 type transport system permease protein [Actinorugispora endophytica]